MATRIHPAPLPLLAVLFSLAAAVFAAAAGPPSTLPAAAPEGVDPALWARMLQIDARAAAIQDVTADFEQKKFTPLLRKPMTSSGSVWAKPSAMLWETRQPEPTVMRVDEREVSIYYPKQKTVEVYPLAGQLAAMASSPLPRLAALLPHFKFAAAGDDDLKNMGDGGGDVLAVRLEPVGGGQLKEHVDHVVVLIDGQRGFIRAFKLIDADGEATVIRFSNVKMNSGIGEARLRLEAPSGVKVVHPLEGLGGGGDGGGGGGPPAPLK